MPKKFENIELPLDSELSDLEEKLSYLDPGFSDYRILRKSVDARKKKNIKWIYTVESYQAHEISLRDARQPLEGLKKYPSKAPVLIIGAGPAGLFCALRLIERGIPSIILEQGEPTEKRVLSIAKYWRKGLLDPHSNVGFGEGGAGLFSDGKLITRIKSPYIPYVMGRLVDFGAPEEIEYLANPHVGSDRIRRLIPKLRNYLLEKGCKIYFNTRVDQLLYKSATDKSGVNKEGVYSQKKAQVEGAVAFDLKTKKEIRFKAPFTVLALGHSTRLYSQLEKDGVFLEGKSFAMGFRVEHSQEAINKIQFGKEWNHPKLGSAAYKLAYTDKDSGVGTYSFCMCPGGYVLSAGTDPEALVCNGMSNYKRNSGFANSALVVSFDFEKNFSNLLEGLEFRNKIEALTYNKVQEAGGTKELPAQRLLDFVEGSKSKSLPEKTRCLSGLKSVNLNSLFEDSSIKTAFRENFVYALKKFNQKMNGFLNNEAVLIGLESRTSSPLRITRDKLTMQSLSHKNLYPAGEGAGYAGGITSAACDGIKIAETIFEEFK